jgi:hypothetical protein
LIIGYIQQFALSQGLVIAVLCELVPLRICKGISITPGIVLPYIFMPLISEHRVKKIAPEGAILPSFISALGLALK